MTVSAPTDSDQESLSARMARVAGATQPAVDPDSQPLSVRMAQVAAKPSEQPSSNAQPKPSGWTMGKPGLGLETGIPEGILALGTGAAGALAAGGLGWLERASGKSWEQIQEDQQALQQRVQFQPQTTIGKGIAQAGGWVGGKLDELGGWAAEHAGNLAEAAGADPTTVAAIKTATHATTMALAPRVGAGAVGAGLGVLRSVGSGAADVASGVFSRSGAPSPLYEAQGGDVAPFAPGGAAAATATGRMSTASPELADSVAAQIAEAQQQYGPDWKSHFYPDALDRNLEADSLGAITGAAPGRLTEGQAAQDPVLISNELNNRGTATDIAKQLQWQNQNLADHLQGIRENLAGPDVNTVTPTEHGQALIDAYQKLHAPRQAEIDSDWSAIRSQTGDAPIFDAGKMLQDAQAALKTKLLSAQDPGGQLAELTDAARRGGLTADGYNEFRHTLGQIAMKGGTEGKAASTVIQATNASELLPEASAFRSAVNDALAKGRALHADVEADPAYDAAVNGTVSANDFVNKFLVRGKVENIAQMAENFGNDDLARQTMSAALVDHLRDSARLNNQYQGNFAADSFNKQLAAIAQRGGPVFQNGELSALQTLGNYARNSTFRPKGNFVSTANTAPAAASMIGRVGGLAGNALEATGNMVVPYLKLGSIVSTGIRARAAAAATAVQELENAKFVHKATRPGAGVIR
jgi:hypothetical protein